MAVPFIVSLILSSISAKVNFVMDSLRPTTPFPSPCLRGFPYGFFAVLTAALILSVEARPCFAQGPAAAIPVPLPFDRYAGLQARSPFVMYKEKTPEVVETNFGQNFKLLSLMKIGEVDSAVLFDNSSQRYISVTSTAPEKSTNIQIESVQQGAGFQRTVILRRGQERASVQLEAAGFPVAPQLNIFHSPDAVESRAIRRRKVETHFVPFDSQALLHDAPIRLGPDRPTADYLAFFTAQVDLIGAL